MSLDGRRAAALLIERSTVFGQHGRRHLQKPGLAWIWPRCSLRHHPSRRITVGLAMDSDPCAHLPRVADRHYRVAGRRDSREAPAFILRRRRTTGRPAHPGPRCGNVPRGAPSYSTISCPATTVMSSPLCISMQRECSPSSVSTNSTPLTETLGPQGSRWAT